VVIGLKTGKGTKQLKLDPTIYDALQKEKVRTLLLPQHCKLCSIEKALHCDASRCKWGM